MDTISKKARCVLYGTAYIAAVSDGRPVPFDTVMTYLRTYAQSLALSESYIAKVFQELSRAGFLRASTGPRGGYQLTRDPEELLLVDLVEAVDGPLVSDSCFLSAEGCPRKQSCGVRRVVREAEMAFYRRLERETLASLARKMDFSDTPGVTPSGLADE